MNYKSFNLGDWIGHISGVIEDETTLDGNEMRDLVWFLTTLKQESQESEGKKMQVVIEIDDIDYEAIKHGKPISAKVMDALIHGTPLPKGHGKIGDLDKLIRAMKERNDDNGGEPLNAVDRGYDLAFQHMTEEAKDCVIIEADKDGAE